MTDVLPLSQSHAETVAWLIHSVICVGIPKRYKGNHLGKDELSKTDLN